MLRPFAKRRSIYVRGSINILAVTESLGQKKRLALVLFIFAVSLSCYELAIPATYFGCLLLLPLLSAAWLFGWRGGLLCLAGLALALALGFGYGLFLGSAFWRSIPITTFITGILSGLIMCLAVGALRRVTSVLLDERQNTTRLLHAYEQEHALNVRKDQVLQDFNHELRNPLTQTDGYLELLETYRDNLDPRTQAHFIALARSGCEELLTLARTAMETIQASGVQHSLNLSVFSLSHEVHTALAHCEPRLLKDHSVELDIPEAMQVYADARFVRQIVRNLLTNAYKYTPDRTHIVISAAPICAMDHPRGQAGMVCLQVRDYGPGIPPEQQARLFQRFARLPNAITSEQPGSGLGLAICKQLVEAMGGAIWVESTGRDGEGSCFSFTLVDGSQFDALDRAKCYGESDGKAQARV